MEDGDISSWWVNHWDGRAMALFDPQTGVFRDCSAMHRPDETSRVRDVAELSPNVHINPDFMQATKKLNPYW